MRVQPTRDGASDLPKEHRHLAWLPLDSRGRCGYWAAMELMGRYAAANHAVIHRHVWSTWVSGARGIGTILCLEGTAPTERRGARWSCTAEGDASAPA